MLLRQRKSEFAENERHKETNKERKQKYLLIIVAVALTAGAFVRIDFQSLRHYVLLLLLPSLLHHLLRP